MWPRGLVGLRDEFLRLLREDEEFRLAVAGLLGLSEILQELRKLREDLSRSLRLEERRLKRHERRWREEEERWKTWYETWRKFLEEHERRWREEEERWKTWYETWRKFLEDYFAFREDVLRRLSRLEESHGAAVEAQFSRYVWEDIRDAVLASGETVVRRMRNADFDGVDIDLLVETENRAFVVEVKTKPRVDDVGTLLVKAEIVREKLGKPVVPVLTGALIGKEVEAFARGKGVLVYSY